MQDRTRITLIGDERAAVASILPRESASCFIRCFFDSVDVLRSVNGCRHLMEGRRLFNNLAVCFGVAVCNTVMFTGEYHKKKKLTKKM